MKIGLPAALLSALLAALLTALLLGRPLRAQETPPPLVARIYVEQGEQIAALAARYDVWEVAADGRSVIAWLDPADAAALAAGGLRVEVDTARSEALRQNLELLAAGNDATIRNFPCYRTLETTNAELRALASNHPTLARWVDIGDSWDKETPGGAPGHDLHALVVTNRSSAAPKFRFVVMGAIHARELATAETAARFAETLVAGYGIDPDITWLLDHGEAHIIPYANPDGRLFAEQGLFWRKNTHYNAACGPPSGSSYGYGIDLNRNSSFSWNECGDRGCSTDQACYPTYRGAAPASEPETQAIEGYLRATFPDLRAPALDAAAPITRSGLFISLHSYGELVLYPWGFTNQPTGNDAALRTLGEKFGYFTGYDVCQIGDSGIDDTCLYPVDGAVDDFAYGELGVPAYTFEMGTDFFQACSVYESEIVTNTLDALHYGFKAARLPYQTPAGPDAVGVTLTPTVVAPGGIVTLTVLLDDSRAFDLRAAHSASVTTPLSAGVVASATWSIDAPSWAAAGAVLSGTLTAEDGAFDSAAEPAAAAIDTTGWDEGRYLVFVEARDGAGNLGPPSAAFLIIGTPPPPVYTVYLPVGQPVRRQTPQDPFP